MSLYSKIKKQFYAEENAYPQFIPQFRIEGRSRDSDNPTGLEMRVADPLWMLGRQWQFGEFKGEDNGSPIGIKVRSRKEMMNAISTGENNTPVNIGDLPLEAVVESKTIKPLGLRDKVRVGQKFESLIQQNFSQIKAKKFIRDLREEYPLQAHNAKSLDRKSRRYFKLMKGNVIDGGVLWALIKTNDFPFGDFQALEKTVEQLKYWYQDLFYAGDVNTTWQQKNLVHKFTIQGEENIQLEAPDYQSGHLDWYSFDTAKIGIDPSKQTKDSAVFMPVNISFAAMPDKRLFAFEDSKLDLSGMNLEKDDLVRLMVLDFSLVSGNDWFTIPLEMELGELCWIAHLEVKDVFGVTTFIRNDADTGAYLDENPLKVWDAFKIRSSEMLRDRAPNELYKKEEHFLYLPPTTTFRQESPPLEELLFVRDEYANMVWAIERTVTNAMGKASNGFDLHLELNGPFLGQEEEEDLDQTLPRFRLAAPVPTNWIPYLPYHIEGSNTEIELKRAVMMRNERHTDPDDVDPLSLLAGEDIISTREESIPRAGIRVQLTKQRVRWTDGKTYVWLGRKVLAGKGEGSSGLSFDQLIYGK